ncbi:MAG: HlyC/CorC family transporter [Planctomycetales bacterium]|nr:HlyC/CorC family transporter [Planctomycetales bacterium]
MNVSTTTLTWIGVAGLLVATWGAIGLKTLREFSRHQLDLYCRNKGRKERFKEIAGDYDEVALGAELLQTLGIILSLGAGMPAFLGEPPWGWLRLLTGLGAALLVMLVCLSWIPWALNRVVSAPLLYHTWSWWKAISALSLPVGFGATVLSSIVARLANRPDPHDEDEEDVFEEEMRAIVSQGLGEGMLEEDAMEMIEGVMELDESDVGDVMTPRSLVDAIEVGTPWDEVVAFVARVRRTRLPVYERDLDNVIGVLYVKDVLAEMAKPPESPRRSLRDLLRLPPKVVKSLPLDDMLHRFLSERSHLAIVLGEFGGMEGVVTIEDVLEEIVGEIEDEKDASDDEIHQADEHTTIALGITHVADLNERLGLTLPEDGDFDTISGYLTHRLGRVPQRDESVVADGVRITVIEANKKAVQRVRLHRCQ